MPTYRALPLLRPLIALILGIYVGFAYPNLNKLFLITIGSFLFATIFCYQILSFKLKQYLYWLSGVAFIGIFFLLGYWSVVRKDITQKENWFGKNKDSLANMVLVLDENPVPKTNNYLTKAEVIAISNNNQYQSSSGTLLIRIDTVLQNQYHFLAEDTLIVQSLIRPIQNFPNSSFDVATYYKRLRIYFQSNIKPQNLTAFHPNTSKGLSYCLQQCRTWILVQLRANITAKDNLSLAEALLIGYKDDLDKNLENAYRDAGIIHIIAISGMHLMLLYKLLEYTGLLFSKKNTAKKITKLLSLVVIWLFAFLSGAGPSVIRAAVMLSFIVVGELFSRQNNSLNSLVTSAFILLLICPEWIWNVGFWLSYMAVLGILLFYKPILLYPDFDNPLMRKIWEGISVTLAAQILTLPILMYCFGRVPLYFLFTNLLMVPLSSGILYLIILLLVVNWIPFLAKIIGNATDFLIGLMNGFVRNVAQYPMANISVSISFGQMMVLYGIIGIVLYLVKKKEETSIYN